MTPTRRVTVPPRSAVAALLEAGATVTVETPTGEQVADVAIVATTGDGSAGGDPGLSAADTTDLLGTPHPTVGDSLHARDGRRLATLRDDDCGANDLLFAPCAGWLLSPPRFRPEPAGCRETLSLALERGGLDRVPRLDALNCFMATDAGPDGVSVGPSPAAPGDAVTLELDAAAAVGVAACPAVNAASGINGGDPGPLAVDLPSGAVARAGVDEFDG